MEQGAQRPHETARSVLLVEDEAIIAVDLQRFLDGTGYHVVGPVASLAEALNKIAAEKLDGAVLDIKFAEDTTQVASALRAAHVPVVFVNGRAVALAPGKLPNRPLLNNPYDYHSLLDALNGAMGRVPRAVG